MNYVPSISEIADKESTTTLLARISAIHDEIIEIDAKIQALGDIGTLQQRVTDLTTTVGGHTTSINGLDTRTTGMIDYVVESHPPNAENNYTWYRKYKSGWLEQGGIGQSQAQSSCDITYPIQMTDTNYTVIAFAKSPHATSNATVHGCHYTNKTTTTCSIISVNVDGDWLAAEINWCVYGYRTE